jgi:hypothetical protein
MRPDLILFVRNRAFALADTGEFKAWPKLRLKLLAEGYDPFLVRRLEGDAYFKFRLRQRVKAALGKARAGLHH